MRVGQTASLCNVRFPPSPVAAGIDPLRTLALSALVRHMPTENAAHKRVISSLRNEVVVLWLIAVAIGAAVMLYNDLAGNGLRKTQMYLAIGYMVYPVFYGCVAYLLWKFGRLLSIGSDYMTAANGTLTIGETVLPIKGIAFDIRRNFLGLREIVFYRDGQRIYAAKTYFMARPFSEVVEDLKYVLQRA